MDEIVKYKIHTMMVYDTRNIIEQPSKLIAHSNNYTNNMNEICLRKVNTRKENIVVKKWY